MPMEGWVKCLNWIWVMNYPFKMIINSWTISITISIRGIMLEAGTWMQILQKI